MRNAVSVLATSFVLIAMGCAADMGADPAGGAGGKADDGNTGAEASGTEFVATWSLRSGPQNNQVETCPEFSSVTMHAVDRDGRDASIGFFLCDDPDGIAYIDQNTTETIYLEFKDINGDKFAQSNELSVSSIEKSTQDAPMECEFAVSVDGGYLSLSWALRDSQASQFLQCQQTGVRQISVVAIHLNSGEAYEQLTSCELQNQDVDSGSTVALLNKLPLGNYEVVVSAVDESGSIVGVAQPISTELAWGNMWLDLGHVAIVLDSP